MTSQGLVTLQKIIEKNRLVIMSNMDLNLKEYTDDNNYLKIIYARENGEESCDGKDGLGCHADRL